jgi:hypothetical protein
VFGLLVQAILDAAAADREEDGHVQAAQQNGVDGEEVAGERRRGVLAQERAPTRPVALWRRRDTGAREHVADERRRDVDPQLAQLADDPHVAPAAVLARQPQDQRAQLTTARRPSPTAVRIRPATSHQPAMPAQQRLRMHQESAPAAPRNHPAQRRKQQPVLRLEPRLADLTAKNRQLVPEHENLELLHPVTPTEEHDQLQQPAHDDVQG